MIECQKILRESKVVGEEEHGNVYVLKYRKHIASNMTLENAIRMGYVVNPKLVYCKYDLITSGKLDQLKEKIEIIEDESKKAEELEIYNELKSKVNREIDDEIEETARKHLNSGESGGT